MRRLRGAFERHCCAWNQQRERDAAERQVHAMRLDDKAGDDRLVRSRENPHTSIRQIYVGLQSSLPA